MGLINRLRVKITGDTGVNYQEKVKTDINTTMFCNDRFLYLDEQKQGSFIWFVTIGNKNIKDSYYQWITFAEVLPGYSVIVNNKSINFLVSLTISDIEKILSEFRYFPNEIFDKFIEDISTNVPSKYLNPSILEEFNIKFSREGVYNVEIDEDFNEKVNLSSRYEEYSTDKISLLAYDDPKMIREAIEYANPDLKDNLDEHDILDVCRILFRMNYDNHKCTYSTNLKDYYIGVYLILSGEVEKVESRDDDFIEIYNLMKNSFGLNEEYLAKCVQVKKFNSKIDIHDNEELDEEISREVLDTSKVSEDNYIKDKGEMNHGSEQ